MASDERESRFTWFFLAIPLAMAMWIVWRVDVIKPMWFDELIVYKIALQRHPSDIWRILASGQSPHPPLNFLVVRCLHAVFGATELATRLPSSVGFLAMEVCLFQFVAKRSNAAYGAAATLFPLVTSARGYAVDAKPYGVVLGWTGIALLCWRCTEGKRRGWALAGLGTALFCATSTHFFGALLALPVLAGEAARSVMRRRADWVVIAVTALNWLPVALFLPILRAGNQVHGIHPWQMKPQFGFVLRSADLLLNGAAAPILLCLLIAVASSRAWPAPAVNPPPLDEVAAAATLALLPVAVICGLKIAGLNIIEVKYLLPMVIGLAILFAWGAYSIAGRGMAAGAALALILGLWGGRDFVRDLRAAQEHRMLALRFAPPRELDRFGPLPIVVETPHFALLEHYAAQETADRIHFLLDPVAAQRYFHSDALHRSMLLNPGFFGAHVENVSAFDAAHREFLIFEQISDGPDWLLEKYKDAGAGIELLKSLDAGRWYLVKSPVTSTPLSQCVRRSDRDAALPAPGCFRPSADNFR